MKEGLCSRLLNGQGLTAAYNSCGDEGEYTQLAPQQPGVLTLPTTTD